MKYMVSQIIVQGEIIIAIYKIDKRFERTYSCDAALPHGIGNDVEVEREIVNPRSEGGDENQKQGGTAKRKAASYGRAYGDDARASSVPR
jgi:hypothetical protein